MIINSPEELRLHLPNHAYDDIDSMKGAFRRSEANVLKDKVGTKLYNAMVEHYNAVQEAERVDWLIQGKDPWAELTFLSQQVVVFDAFMRNADINAISVNQSGINMVSAENYDSASNDRIKDYKKQLNKETHDAVNELLVWLEELEKESIVELSEGMQDESDESEGDTAAQEIIELWKESKYYYMVQGLFINTATMFDHYVDIYENRERFISLLPDIRYCQKHYIENELGEDMTKTLLEVAANGKANEEQARAIGMIREALALCVETRSKMFNRAEAKDEAVGSVKLMAEYVNEVLENVGKNADEMQEKPCGEAQGTTSAQPHHTDKHPKPEGMFVMPPIV